MFLGVLHNIRVSIRRWRYPGSRRYWQRRYARGGHSGAGSSGAVAAYKAEVLNRFVCTQGISSVTELGCGDGQQLLLADYPAYTGLDIAPAAINRCRALFAADASKRFAVYHPETYDSDFFRSDMALSTEVIFHLTEDALYRLYLRHLFASAHCWVVIFSSDMPDTTGGVFPHFRSRRFTPDVPAGWVLRERLPNPLAASSISEFFFFEKE